MKKKEEGRPTKYKKKYCQELKKFFSKERFREIKIITTGKNNYSKEEIKLIANELPTLERFAEKIEVDEDTITNWGKKHKEFFGAIGACKAIQKDFLIQNGLLGLYQSNFAIFVAKNLTDMKDKTEQEVDIKGKLDVSLDKEIEKIYGNSNPNTDKIGFK